MVFMGMGKEYRIQIFSDLFSQKRVYHLYGSYFSSDPTVQKNTAVIPAHKKTVSGIFTAAA
jgi:hypothetical protein